MMDFAFFRPFYVPGTLFFTQGTSVCNRAIALGSLVNPSKLSARTRSPGLFHLEGRVLTFCHLSAEVGKKKRGEGRKKGKKEKRTGVQVIDGP